MEEARVAADAAVEADGQNVHVRCGVSVALGALWNSAADREKAVEHARVAVEIWPEYLWSRRALGRALCAAGKWQDSIDVLMKVVEQATSEESEDRLYVALAHHGLRNAKEARRWYDEAVAKEKPGMPDRERYLRVRRTVAAKLGIKDVPK
jgi:tetratricopeptide (TPR) repeat protein